MLPVLLAIGPITIYSLGVFLAVGFFLGCFITWRRFRDLGLEEEKILDAIILSTVGGLVLAKLIFVFGNFPAFSGFSFWGGLAGFLLVFLWFTKSQNWDFWQLVDELTFALLPWTVLYQIGAFLDGSNLGKPTQMPWGVYFPGSLFRSQPIALFKAVAFFVIWIVILRIERYWRNWAWYKSKQNGLIFLIFSGLALLNNGLLDFWSVSGLYWFWAEVGLSLLGITVVFFMILIRSGIYGSK